MLGKRRLLICSHKSSTSVNPFSLYFLKRPKAFMKALLTLFLSALAITTFAQSGTTAAFTSGNIIVYRVGDGVHTLRGYSAPVYLDEYTPAGALVQSIRVPAKTASAAGLTAQGTSTTEGMLTRTVDGKYVVFTGYNADTGVQQVSNTQAATVARAIGRADAAGTLTISPLGTTAFSSGAIRSAASADGTTVYVAGANSGIRKAVFGDTTTIRISATLASGGTANPANFRAVGIYGGQLYASTNSGTSYRMVSIGTGTPTDTGAAVTKLPGVPTTITPGQFFFADIDATTPGVDVLYLADNGSTTGGIQKYSLVNGTWVANGKRTPSVTGPVGLTGVVTGSTVKLYTTSGSTNNTTYVLYALTDTTGYNKTITGTFTLLATASASTAFRGVALAPQSTTPSFDTDHFRSVATGNWNSTATWQSSADSINWHAATLIPGAAAASITIRSPHTVTVTANATANKPSVNTGATLHVNTGVVFTTQ